MDYLTVAQERVVYDGMRDSVETHLTMHCHLALYTFAHLYIYQKKILDAACGTCFGSMIFSTAASSIICVDNNKKAIAHGKKLPMFCPTIYLVRDLEKQILPEADVCVSIETIEHLNGDGFFLRNLNVKELIFAVPMHMPGAFHKISFDTPEEWSKYFYSHGWGVEYGVVTDEAIPVRSNSVDRLLRGSNFMGVARHYETKRKD